MCVQFNFISLWFQLAGEPISTIFYAMKILPKDEKCLSTCVRLKGLKGAAISCREVKTGKVVPINIACPTDLVEMIIKERFSRELRSSGNDRIIRNNNYHSRFSYLELSISTNSSQKS